MGPIVINEAMIENADRTTYHVVSRICIYWRECISSRFSQLGWVGMHVLDIAFDRHAWTSKNALHPARTSINIYLH